jgi:hypothetical protein
MTWESKSTNTGQLITRVILDDRLHTFDSFLLIMPTRSSVPTAYLPKFSPVCAPDNALNPITAALIFHLPPLTSIQCAVIPWNPTLVVSADQASEVIDTLPGAACTGVFSICLFSRSINSPLSGLSAPSCGLRTDCEYTPLQHARSEGRKWWIWASSR